MPTPEALQEISYSAFDEVFNRRDPYIYDRKQLPWLSFIEGKTQVVGATGGKEVVKIQVKGGLTGEHWDGRDVLSFKETRVDLELEYPLRRTHMGLEILHTELEDQGYSVTPNGPRGRNFAQKMSAAEAHRIMDIFEMKIDDLMNAWDEFMDETFLLDGTQDPLAPVGLDGYLPLDPTAGTIGGKSRSNPILRHWVTTGSTTGSGGTLERDLVKLFRRANENNRGMRSMVDVIFAGDDWIDGLVAWARANNLDLNGNIEGIKKLDIAIPDDVVFFHGIPVVRNPTFNILDSKYAPATPWSKRAYGLASKTWVLAHPRDKMKQFSAPLDPPDQRFSRISLDGRHVLIPKKPIGNFVSTIA